MQSCVLANCQSVTAQRPVWSFEKSGHHKIYKHEKVSEVCLHDDKPEHIIRLLKEKQLAVTGAVEEVIISEDNRGGSGFSENVDEKFSHDCLVREPFQHRKTNSKGRACSRGSFDVLSSRQSLLSMEARSLAKLLAPRL